jgi:magnesium transporter
MDTSTGSAQDLNGLSIRAAIASLGSCREVTPDEAVAAARNSEIVWMHLVARDSEEARHLLHDRLGFHELLVEDALSKDERPALHEDEESLFLVAPAALVESGGERYLEVGFFMTQAALVTVSTEPVPLIEVWLARWSRRPIKELNSPSRLLHSLLDALVDDYFPAIDRLEDEIDDVTEAVFEGDSERVRELLGLKRRLLELRRRVGPLREVLNGLLRRDVILIEKELSPYFQDVYDHALRIGELIDMNRETLATVMDIHLTTVSNSLNEVMRKLTVIATVLMSMALIAGVYGMNFERMPELGWAYGYPFALGLMGLSALVIYTIFRRMRWI